MKMKSHKTKSKHPKKNKKMSYSSPRCGKTSRDKTLEGWRKGTVPELKEYASKLAGGKLIPGFSTLKRHQICGYVEYLLERNGGAAGRASASAPARVPVPRAAAPPKARSSRVYTFIPLVNCLDSDFYYYLDEVVGGAQKAKILKDLKEKLRPNSIRDELVNVRDGQNGSFTASFASPVADEDLSYGNFGHHAFEFTTVKFGPSCEVTYLVQQEADNLVRMMREDREEHRASVLTEVLESLRPAQRPAQRPAAAPPLAAGSSGECVRQTSAKYSPAKRPGPPYPAQSCRGQKREGNDGLMYESRPTKGVTKDGGQVWRWFKLK
jgi:hypothetical protein